MDQKEREPGCTCRIGTSENPVLGGYARCPVHDPNMRRFAGEALFDAALAKPAQADRQSELPEFIVQWVEAEADKVATAVNGFGFDRASWVMGVKQGIYKMLPLLEALQIISNPVKHMREAAAIEGAQLDGVMAMAIAKDPNWLKAEARKAIDQYKQSFEVGKGAQGFVLS